jgi:hypothetical protein
MGFVYKLLKHQGKYFAKCFFAAQEKRHKGGQLFPLFDIMGERKN